MAFQSLATASLEPDTAERPMESLEDLDLILLEGRQGEAIMEAKAGISDSIALLTGLVFAFALSILSGDSFHPFGIDADTPDDAEIEGEKIMVSSFLYLSAVAGFCGLMINTFLSAKLRRLSARSLFSFGVDVPVETLVKLRRGETKLREQLEPAVRNNSQGECRFHAREWYNGTSGGPAGRALFNYGFLCMGATMSAFMLAVFAKVLKVFYDWSWTVQNVRLLVMIEMGCYALVLVSTFVVLGKTGAMQDLE